MSPHGNTWLVNFLLGKVRAKSLQGTGHYLKDSDVLGPDTARATHSHLFDITVSPWPPSLTAAALAVLPQRPCRLNSRSMDVF